MIPAPAQSLSPDLWQMAPVCLSFLVYKIGAIMLLPMQISYVLKTVLSTWKFSINMKL